MFTNFCHTYNRLSAIDDYLKDSLNTIQLSTINGDRLL